MKKVSKPFKEKAKKTKISQISLATLHVSTDCL